GARRALLGGGEGASEGVHPRPPAAGDVEQLDAAERLGDRRAAPTTIAMTSYALTAARLIVFRTGAFDDPAASSAEQGLTHAGDRTLLSRPGVAVRRAGRYANPRSSLRPPSSHGGDRRRDSGIGNRRGGAVRAARFAGGVHLLGGRHPPRCAPPAHRR